MRSINELAALELLPYTAANRILSIMKILNTILIILFVVLQLRLWFGEGSVSHVFLLKSKVQEQELVNQQWHDKNELLAAEVLDLQKGSEAIEEYARTELGMIKKHETFFLVVKPQ